MSGPFAPVGAGSYAPRLALRRRAYVYASSSLTLGALPDRTHDGRPITWPSVIFEAVDHTCIPRRANCCPTPDCLWISPRHSGCVRQLGYICVCVCLGAHTPPTCCIICQTVNTSTCQPVIISRYVIPVSISCRIIYNPISLTDNVPRFLCNKFHPINHNPWVILSPDIRSYSSLMLNP